MNVKTSFFGSRLYIDVRLSCLFRILNLTWIAFDLKSDSIRAVRLRISGIRSPRRTFVRCRRLSASVRRDNRFGRVRTPPPTGRRRRGSSERRAPATSPHLPTSDRRRLLRYPRKRVCGALAIVVRRGLNFYCCLCCLSEYLIVFYHSELWRIL